MFLLTGVLSVTAGWDFWYVVSTLRPIVAPVQPMPRQALVMQRYRAGALVYALQDCGGFVVSSVQACGLPADLALLVCCACMKQTPTHRVLPERMQPACACNSGREHIQLSESEGGRICLPCLVCLTRG